MKHTCSWLRTALLALFATAGTALSAQPLLPFQRKADAMKDRPVTAQRRTVTAKAADGTTLYGFLIYSDAWGANDSKYGFYSFAASADQNAVAVSPTDDYFYNANGGAVVADGTVHMVNTDTQYGTTYITYYAYDYETWEPVASVGRYGTDLDDYRMVATDLTVDPKTGNVYGCFSNAANTAYELGIADFRTLTRSTIANYGVTPVLALAFDANGTLFGVKGNGHLYTIDKAGGEQTDVADLGISLVALPQSMTFDYATGKLYLAAQETGYTSALYCININYVGTLPVGATAERIKEFALGEEFTGLYVPAPAAAADAPAAVTDLRADYPGGALSGRIAFTLPTLSTSGAPLTGTLQGTVLVNSTTEYTFSGTPGEAVTIPAELAAGYTTVAVTVSNAAGDSPRATLAFWAGPDTPKAPAAATLAIDEAGKATVTWEAVSEGINAGYIGAVTYTVTRMPGNVVVAEGLTGTSFSETLPATTFASYSYTITAVSNGLASEAAATNAVTYGAAFEVPYNATFDTQDDLALFTVLNGNADLYRWVWNAKDDGVVICPTGTTQSDDWLITPPVHLVPGKDYTFSVDYRCYSSTYPERMEIAFGTNNRAEGYATLLPATDVTFERYFTFQTIVKVEEDGYYYFGIHDISGANAMYLQIDNISVTEGADVTEMVNAVSATDFSDLMAVVGGSADARITLTNAGTERVQRIAYTVTSAEGTSEEREVTLTDGPTYGNSVTVTVPVPASAEPGYTERAISITKVNGVDNDVRTDSRTARGRIVTLAAASPRRSVVEEFTGAWCGNCPRGIAGLARMEASEPAFIGIAVHCDDPMEIAPYTPIKNRDDLVPGYPHAQVNRMVGCDPYYGMRDYESGEPVFSLDKVWSAQQEQLVEAAVKLTEATLESGAVRIKSETTFQYNRDDAPYALAYVLLCDSVQRPAAASSNQDIIDWMQTNYLSGATQYASDPWLKPWVDAPYRIAAMSYNHVAVAASDVVDGIAGSIAAPITAGAVQRHDYRFELSAVPLAQREDLLRVVVLLLNTRNSTIVNADELHVSVPTGIARPATDSGADTEVVARYSVSGQRIGAPQRGVNIVRMGNGEVRKVLVK
ncbi:MAG: choice-of-anchor J domain-containing protein [Alloprevotella sp.]|nr:choice-of-anchor J domain-containing protein [Alloprevotella sp.]